MSVSLNEHAFSMVPFWFWNGDQNEDEITRQLELAAKAGFRGMALHARTGNKTPYMSPRWLELAKYTCEEAKRLHLEIWLYDEEGFPSGTVGGRLPAKGPFYQQKFLNYRRMSAKEAASLPDLLRAFPVEDLTTAADPAALPPDAEVLAFQVAQSPHHLSDCLSREVCEEFLRMTHEKYVPDLGKFFGSTVPVVYTDDLNHLLGNGAFFSWTEKLCEEFRTEHGYELPDKLPALVENLPGAVKVRIDYRATLLRLFNDNFVRPMREWSEKHSMILTGHLSGDEGPLILEANNYTDPFLFYKTESIPGVDDYLTGNHTGRYLLSPINFMRNGRTCNKQKGFSIIQLCKKASSVSSQFKDGLCSSEVLTSLGWGIPPYIQMAQLKVQLGCGINIMVPHDCAYATAAHTKRDHPESLFFQEPYFRYTAGIHKSVNRSMQLISRGRCDANLMVLYPIRSFWAIFDGSMRSENYNAILPGSHTEMKDAQPFTDMLAELSLKLSKLHIDFEFASENLFPGNTSIENGRFRVGAASYSTVLLPEAFTVSPVTKALLDEFDAQGGHIVVLGRAPEQIDGAPMDAAPAWKHLVHVQNASELDASMFEPPALDFSPLPGSETDEIQLHTRITPEGREFYLANFSDRDQKISVHAPGTELFDPESGNLLTGAENAFTLPAFATCHILPAGTMNVPSVPVRNTSFRIPGEESAFPLERWTIEPEQDNVLCVDHAQNADGKDIVFSERENWDIPAGSSFHADFTLDELPGEAFLFFETDNIANLKVNGTDPGQPDAALAATQDLHGVSIARLLKKGLNSIAFTNNVGRIENLYLTSPDFRVQLRGADAVLSCDSPEIELGDLATQGFPFYWGQFRYSAALRLHDCPRHGETYFLRIPDAEGVLSLRVNGEDFGVLVPSPACEVNITKALQAGLNRVELLLANTAQNFYGPHRANDIRENACSTAWHPALPANAPAKNRYVASFGIKEAPLLIRAE